MSYVLLIKLRIQTPRGSETFQGFKTCWDFCGPSLTKSTGLKVKDNTRTTFWDAHVSLLKTCIYPTTLFTVYLNDEGLQTNISQRNLSISEGAWMWGADNCKMDFNIIGIQLCDHQLLLFSTHHILDIWGLKWGSGIRRQPSNHVMPFFFIST